jgi:hypothetical protein
MDSYNELNQLQAEKFKMAAKEKQICEQRKIEIATLAERYGVLTLPDDEIKLAFQNIVYNHYHYNH